MLAQFNDVIRQGSVGFMSNFPSSSSSSTSLATDSPPTYKQVCSGTTPFVEVYQFHYDSLDDSQYMYEKFLRHFFQFHDPTTLDAQGNDR